MVCIAPRIILRNGVDIPKNVRGLWHAMSSNDRALDSKELIRTYPEYFMIVPCKQCRPCRKSLARMWTVRLLYESDYWNKLSFVSLDYAPEFLPFLPDGSNLGTLYQIPYNLGSTLDKDAVPKFMKRLRTNYYRDHGVKLACKVYYCGEYGDLGRPHYHLILFGLDHSDRDVLERSWPYGRVDIAHVELESIQYVTGYVQKKLNGNLGSEVYGDRVVPFGHSSKGLGLNYFLDHKSRFYQDLKAHLQGRKVTIPRYFLDHDEDLTALLESTFSDDLLKSYLEDPRQFWTDNGNN